MVSCTFFPLSHLMEACPLMQKKKIITWCCSDLIASRHFPHSFMHNFSLNVKEFFFFDMLCDWIFRSVWALVSRVEAFCHHQLVMLDPCTHHSTDSLWLTDYELHLLTFGQLHSLPGLIVAAEHKFCRWMSSGNWILIEIILLLLVSVDWS